MPGNPGKEGRTGPEYQIGRRRYTRVPGYHSVLPRVFPFRWKCTLEQAEEAVDLLMTIGRTGYAVTSHPAAVDGHVHLWMSAEGAEYLADTMYVIPTGKLEKTS